MHDLEMTGDPEPFQCGIDHIHTRRRCHCPPQAAPTHVVDGVTDSPLGLAALADMLDDARVDIGGQPAEWKAARVPRPPLEPVADDLLGAQPGGLQALVAGQHHAGPAENLHLGVLPERLGVDQQAIEIEDRGGESKAICLTHAPLSTPSHKYDDVCRPSHGRDQGARRSRCRSIGDDEQRRDRP